MLICVCPAATDFHLKRKSIKQKTCKAGIIAKLMWCQTTRSPVCVCVPLCLCIVKKWWPGSNSCTGTEGLSAACTALSFSTWINLHHLRFLAAKKLQRAPASISLPAGGEKLMTCCSKVKNNCGITTCVQMTLQIAHSLHMPKGHLGFCNLPAHETPLHGIWWSELEHTPTNFGVKKCGDSFCFQSIYNLKWK